MSLKEGNVNETVPATSELYSNLHPRRQPGNGKLECSAGDTRRIPAAKAGNTAIPFQSEHKILKCSKDLLWYNREIKNNEVI